MLKMHKQLYGKIDITLLSVEHYKSKEMVDKLLKQSKFDKLLIEANDLIINTIKVNNIKSSEIHTIITQYTDKIIPIDISFNKEINYYKLFFTKITKDQLILKYLTEKHYFNKEIFISKEYYDTFILYREEQMMNNIKSYLFNNKNNKHSILILTGYFHHSYIKKHLENI